MQRFKFPQYHLKWPTIKITKGTWLALFEVLLIAISAIRVGRGMLEFDVERIPPGTEFPWVIQTNIIWRMLPCSASAMGGNIDVKYKSDAAGILVIEENYFPGWQAWQDGKPRQFESGR